MITHYYDIEPILILIENNYFAFSLMQSDKVIIIIIILMKILIIWQNVSERNMKQIIIFGTALHYNYLNSL